MLFMLVKGNNIKVFPTLKLPKRYQYEGMEREKTTQNLVFALFSHVEMIRCETLVACFTLADTIQNLLENHEVFKIAVFSHCFPIKRKSSYVFVVTASFSMWTSLGLNQGPPDYESICNIFHKIINNHKTLIFSVFFILQISENCLTLHQFSFQKVT